MGSRAQRQLRARAVVPVTQQDLYAALGVSRAASAAEIKAAYRRAAARLHPDRNADAQAAEQMAAVNIAYEVLSDPELRARYDRGESVRRGPSPEDRARQEFYVLLNTVLDSFEYADPIAQMREQVRTTIAETRHGKAMASSYVKKLRRTRKFVMRKNGGENLVHDVLDAKITAAVSAAAAMREKLLMLKHLLALIEEYAWTDKAPKATSSQSRRAFYWERWEAV